LEGVITDKGKSGHKERLRKRFLAGEERSQMDDPLFELLLTYAISKKDEQAFRAAFPEFIGNSK